MLEALKSLVARVPYDPYPERIILKTKSLKALFNDESPVGGWRPANRRVLKVGFVIITIIKKVKGAAETSLTIIGGPLLNILCFADGCSPQSRKVLLLLRIEGICT